MIWFNSEKITYESHQSKCIIPTKNFCPHTSEINHKGVSFIFNSTRFVPICLPWKFCDRITSVLFWLCENMSDCSFLHYEVINNDSTNSIVLHFYADIEKNNIIIFFSQIWTLELHISRTVWWILVIRISLFSIFKACLNQRNTCLVFGFKWFQLSSSRFCFFQLNCCINEVLSQKMDPKNNFWPGSSDPLKSSLSTALKNVKAENRTLTCCRFPSFVMWKCPPTPRIGSKWRRRLKSVAWLYWIMSAMIDSICLFGKWFDPIHARLFLLFKSPGGSSGTPLGSQKPFKLAQWNFAL